MAIPDALSARWSLENVALLQETPNGLVYRAIRDGQRVFLKIIRDEALEECIGLDFLQWRDGCGAVRVLERQGNAALMDDAGDMPLRRYCRDKGDAAGDKVIASVLASLHAERPSPPPSSLVPLSAWFAALTAPATLEAPAAIKASLGWAAGIASRKLRLSRDRKPLHGDLHHDNILSQNGRDWTAIDPKGLIGDAPYDVANCFGNPIGDIATILDPARIKRMAACFAGSLQRTESDILGWAAAHAGLSIAWSLSRNETKERDAAIAGRHALLMLLRDQFELS